MAGTALCEPPCADYVAGTALSEPPCAEFVAGAALCEPPCAEFVAGAALCEARGAGFVAGAAVCEPPVAEPWGFTSASCGCTLYTHLCAIPRTSTVRITLPHLSPTPLLCNSDIFPDKAML